METVHFTIVVDDVAEDGLVAEHGFSLWIESGARTILFDTGNKGALLPNTKALGLDLSKVSDLVLSHGHYDHTGGVDEVLRQAQGIHVYMHQRAIQPRYKVLNGSATSNCMPPRSTQALDGLGAEQMSWVTKPVEISRTVGISGPIPRLTEYEDTGGSFYCDPQGKQPDPLEDDLAMWIGTPQGLVVCVGCSHAGIVNTLKGVMKITGVQNIHTVIGGLHLLNASSERLHKSAAALNTLGITQLIACHCTGDTAVEFLEKNLTFRVVRGYAGFSIGL